MSHICIPTAGPMEDVKSPCGTGESVLLPLQVMARTTVITDAQFKSLRLVI